MSIIGDVLLSLCLDLSKRPPIYPIPPTEKDYMHASGPIITVDAQDQELQNCLWIIDQIKIQQRNEMHLPQIVKTDVIELNILPTVITDIIFDYIPFGCFKKLKSLWNNLCIISKLFFSMQNNVGSNSAGLMYCYQIYTLPQLFIIEYLLTTTADVKNICINYEFRQKILKHLLVRFGKDDIHPCVAENSNHLSQLIQNAINEIKTYSLWYNHCNVVTE